MKTTAVGILILLVLTFTFPLQALSHSEERFGPWRYYAPYYFPPDRCCLGYCFSPDDFRPTYESPNPPQPKNDAPPRCAAPPPPPQNAAHRGNPAPQAARQMPPMKPMLGDRPGAPAKRPFPGSAATYREATPTPGQPRAALSPRQGSQPRMVTPPASGPQVR
jgi:hypothetical protein